MSFGHRTYSMKTRRLQGLMNLYTKVFGVPHLGTQIRAPYVMKHVDVHLGDFILDAGCGPAGFYSFECAFEGAKVVSLDVSKEKVRELRNVSKKVGLRYMFHFITADICALPIKAGVFDTILSVSVIEHIQHDVKAIAEQTRVLRKNGHFIIHVPQPTPTFFANLDYKSFDQVREGYTLKHIKPLLEKCGLKVVVHQDTIKAFACLAIEISYTIRRPILRVLICPLLYLLSRLDFLSNRTGRGLLLVATKS